jgi:subtilisin family serine protease
MRMKRLTTAAGIALVLCWLATTALGPTPRAAADIGPPGAAQIVNSPDTASDDGNLILLQAATIDTSQSPSFDLRTVETDLQAMGLEAKDRAYYLVQFRGAIREAWKMPVRDAGGQIAGFVPNHALVVKMDGHTANAVAALPEVRWVGLYRPDYKVAPQLAAAQSDTAEPLAVSIMTFDPAAAEEVARTIETLGGQPLDWQSGARWGTVRAEIATSMLGALARLVEVSWVEPYVVPTLDNDVSRGAGGMNVDVVHQTYGLTGAGQIIGHADTGLDVGNLATLHPDLRGRVVAAYAWGRRSIGAFDSPGSGPMGLVWDGSRFWHIDWVTDLLYQLTSAGAVVSSCAPTVIGRAAGLAWDGSSLWYVERDDNAVYRIDTACNVLGSFATPGTSPNGLAWDGTNLWLSDIGTDTIYRMNTAGTVLQSFASPGPYPSSLMWADGSLWCGDSTEDLLYRLSTSGQVLDWVPSPGQYSSGIAWDGSEIWISDPGFDRIFEVIPGVTIQGDWSDPDGHGTHTAGSILGDGTASGGQYKGTAPDAELVHQSVMDYGGGLDGLPLDLGDLFSQAYDLGARIHSNSWGAAVAGAYNANAAEVDSFMWDHKDMLVVFSAGNSGTDVDQDGVIDPDSIGSPGTAKNVLTVGAAENERPSIAGTWSSFGYAANPIHDDPMADNFDGMAAFSSRGPTDDGRIKPDVVAPGTYIVSTRSQAWPFYDDTENVTTVAATAETDVAPHCAPLDGTDVVSGEKPLEGDWSVCTEDKETQVNDGDVSAAWTPTGGWTTTTADAHSPTHAWVDNYAASASDRLTSGVMDVRTGGSVIGFWTKYSFETGDRGYLYFSDNGSDWIGYSIQGTQADWTYVSYSIPWGYCWVVSLPVPPYVEIRCFSDASTFRFRFQISADSDASTGWWYIDDVRVYNSGWGLLSDEGMASPGSADDENYIFMGGTSMSTPLTAGAAALVRQYYTETEGIDPSAALVKATLINGAADMTPGQYGVGSSGAPLLQDDMESGAGQWTAGAPWALTTAQFHSASHSWTDSPAGNYANNANVTLTLNPSLDLTTIANPGLTFWHGYDLERGYDYGTVEVSTNGGISWTVELAFTGSYTTWHRSVLDLSAYAAETALQVRFRLQSDSSNTRDGWYIDDVRIEPVSFQEIAGRPDGTQGWGRVDVGNSLFPAAPRELLYRDATSGLSTGVQDTLEFTVTNSSEALRVTLAWTDYPSLPAAAVHLVNNLDLRLIGPGGTVYYPNGQAGADAINNVEGIEIANPPLGVYTIEIDGTEVIQGPQPYALVISGALSVAGDDSFLVYLPAVLRSFTR